jgi:glutamate-1-semialdehyde 2,1-aminomutase
MCNPRSTVLWLKDWNKVKSAPEQMDEAHHHEYSNYNWINDDYLITEMENKIDQLDTLHFAGGEPLIAPKMVQMLQVCIDRNVASKISLSYNTNITKLPERVLEQWKHFKEVKLLCSIDGFGKVNEYIRMPSRWEVIDKNLRFLDDHAETFKISEILLSCTVQAYNILNLTDLYDYLKTFKVISPALNLINLFGPDYLMTQILPRSVKEEATQRLEALKPELLRILPDYKHYLIENIDQTINFMNTKDLHPYLWDDFVSYNRKIDQTKGMSLADYIPELASVIEGSV